MSTPIFSLDDEAIAHGGEKAGAYLDKLGKTDLAKLSKEEWDQFCKTLVWYTWAKALDLHIGEADSGKQTGPIRDSEVPF